MVCKKILGKKRIWKSKYLWKVKENSPKIFDNIWNFKSFVSYFKFCIWLPVSALTWHVDLALRSVAEIYTSSTLDFFQNTNTFPKSRMLPSKLILLLHDYLFCFRHWRNDHKCSTFPVEKVEHVYHYTFYFFCQHSGPETNEGELEVHLVAHQWHFQLLKSYIPLEQMLRQWSF